MTNLPVSSSLPIESLAACFQETTTSYKFYWFIAILEHIKTYNTQVISIDELKLIMIAKIWYPTVYYNLSFGKQDKLSIAAKMLDNTINSKSTTEQQAIIDKIVLLKKNSVDFAKEFGKRGRYEPYRFLEPFFHDKLCGLKDHEKNRKIAELSKASFLNSNTPSIYQFIPGRNKKIEIHPEWYVYLQKNIAILEDYCLWNLLQYLQPRNPNVPNIASKLFPPKDRKLKNARDYWELVLQKLHGVRCIYSDVIIPINSISLDHFLPWRYVTHDLLWNIIPTVPSVNSSKGDRLPNFDKYFDSFSHVQFSALQIVAPLEFKLTEDYMMLFACENRDELLSIPYDAFFSKLKETLAPQFQIARSMGFIGNWIYFPS
jgi:hypothetical protein